MKFLNINQFMNTNMREKMLKNISNTLCKHNLSEIACKTENRPDDIYVRTHISKVVKVGCNLKTRMPARNDR